MIWHHRLQAELRNALDQFLPPLCLVCRSREAVERGAMLCDVCRGELPPFSGSACSCCALPFVAAAGDHRCESCLRSPPNFTAIAFHGLFSGTLRDTLHRFKYHRDVTLARPLGALVATSCRAAIADHAPELIIAVPLHRSRLRSRGYNQALLLAAELRGVLAVPLARQGLRRLRPTAAQQGLDADSRRRNVRGAFEVDAPLVRGRRILLVDDVMTTGATLNECARTLRRSGAAAVMAAVVARVDREPELFFE